MTALAHIAILLTSLAGLVTAVATLLRQVRLAGAVQDVHVLVNQQAADMRAEIAHLKVTIRDLRATRAGE